MKTKIKDIEGKSEKPCEHFMVWNIQGGHSYYRCDKCNFIDGEETFKDFMTRQKISELVRNCVGEERHAYYPDEDEELNGGYNKRRAEILAAFKEAGVEI